MQSDGFCAGGHPVTPVGRTGGILSLPSDVLQYIAKLLKGELLTFACTCAAFDQARRHSGLLLLSHGRQFVRRLRLLEWAVSHVAWDTVGSHQARGCVWAAEAGCLPAILWLRGEGFWLCGEDCLAAAAGGGHYEVLIALWARGLSPDTRACAWAAASGHLTTLQVARRLGFVWDSVTTSNAASRCAPRARDTNA